MKVIPLLARKPATFTSGGHQSKMNWQTLACSPVENAAFDTGQKWLSSAQAH